MSSTERAFDEHAAGCSAGDAGGDPRTGEGGDAPAGYAVEYDFVDPTELYATLETKRLEGLFHAGRSTGRPDTRRRRRKGWWRGSMRR